MIVITDGLVEGWRDFELTGLMSFVRAWNFPNVPITNFVLDRKIMNLIKIIFDYQEYIKSQLIHFIPTW